MLLWQQGFWLSRSPVSGGNRGENRMKDYTEYTDEELVDLLRQGETEVMDYLLEKYKFIVRQKARVLYLAGGEADDLIQEGMIGLFKAIRDYRGDKEASFYTFAQLCVDRQMYNAIQSSTRQKHQPLNSYVSMNGEEWESQMGSKTQQSPESIIIAQENAVLMEENIRISEAPSSLALSIISVEILEKNALNMIICPAPQHSGRINTHMLSFI